MSWLWLFTAVLVLILGPSWSRPAGAAECGGWNTEEFFETAPPERVRACLAAGADPKATNEHGQRPWDLAQDNEALRGTVAWWRLRRKTGRVRRACLKTRVGAPSLRDVPAGDGDVTSPLPAQPQREALEALYEATVGPNWVHSTNWTTPAPLDEWYGVDTDAAGNVTELDLSSNQLCGPLPAALGNLSQLRSLDLSSNQLRGPLPAALGRLSQLYALFLSHNGLSGPLPAELGNLSQLHTLFLAHNGLSGPLPAELGNLSQLKRLYLTYNVLSGPLPAALGNLSNLRWLALTRNTLSGPLPAELGRLSQLHTLFLARNRLSGAIPATLAHLSALQHLSLHSNAALSGVLPIGLQDLPLTNLQIQHTQIRVPPDAAFRAWLATITFTDGGPAG